MTDWEDGTIVRPMVVDSHTGRRALGPRVEVVRIGVGIVEWRFDGCRTVHKLAREQWDKWMRDAELARF